MPFEIRPLRPEDEADWRRLWTGYLAFYDTTLPEAIFARNFSLLLQDQPLGYRGFLGLADGRPAGLVHYLFHAHGWKPHPTCYLQDLFVDPRVRGTGLGRRLIQAVYDAAVAVSQ
jgi:GNAT superfamily N-acetyltransferase